MRLFWTPHLPQVYLDEISFLNTSESFARSGLNMMTTLRDENEAFFQVGFFRETSDTPESIVIDHVIEATTLEEVTPPIGAEATSNLTIPFEKPLAPGFYKVRATFREQGQFREFYENGFWVAERGSLDDGEALGVKGDFLTRGGKPFFPVGTNVVTATASNQCGTISCPFTVTVVDRTPPAVTETGQPPGYPIPANDRTAPVVRIRRPGEHRNGGAA